MKYVALPWHCFSPRDEHFAQFLKLLRDNPDKKVFVHCRLGDDRTGMEIAAYRMAEQGWSAEEPSREMEIFGVNWFHRTICPRLESYEKEFPERFKTSPAFQGLRSDRDAPQTLSLLVPGFDQRVHESQVYSRHHEANRDMGRIGGSPVRSSS